MSCTLSKIWRYPVKGLSAQELPAVELVPDKPLPDDRRYALLHGPAALDMDHEGWRPKSDFLTLMRHERLAALDTQFDEETQTLVVLRGGKPVARGRLDQPTGRMLLEQFFAAYMAGAAPGAPKIVEAKGFAFTDSEEPVVSLLNLASARDLERVTKQPVHPARFRANLWLDGLAPWSMRHWVGRTVAIGAVRLEVQGSIPRCAATEVNPDTGARDMGVLQALQRGYGHVQCGLYARVVEGGRIAPGDPVSLL